MTRKDYQLVANAIASLEKINPVEKRILVARLAGAFAGDNPRFKPEVFAEECYS